METPAFIPTPEQLKTVFNEMELNYFRSLILNKREEAQKELDFLTDSINEMRTQDEDDASSSAHHMGDLGSKEESLDLSYRLMQRNKKFIRELDRALLRIENGTYGMCRATGKPIEKGRLEFAPHTRYSIEAKNSGLDKKPQLV